MMSTVVRQHGGRAVGSRGDSLLAEFPSVVASAHVLHYGIGVPVRVPVHRANSSRLLANLLFVVAARVGRYLHTTPGSSG
jgi:hypothetical protein